MSLLALWTSLFFSSWSIWPSRHNQHLTLKSFRSAYIGLLLLPFSSLEVHLLTSNLWLDKSVYIMFIVTQAVNRFLKRENTLCLFLISYVSKFCVSTFILSFFFNDTTADHGHIALLPWHGPCVIPFVPLAYCPLGVWPQRGFISPPHWFEVISWAVQNGSKWSSIQ